MTAVLLLEAAFPTRRGEWPVLWSGPGGAPTWGTWDPGTGAVTAADPTSDPRLPGLREWLPRGRLVAYRAGRRGVVRVDAPGGTRWVKVVRPKVAPDVVARHLAASAVVGVRAPEVLDVDLPSGVVVLSSVAGRPLSDPTAAADRAAAVRAVGEGLAVFGAAREAWAAPDGSPVVAAAERDPWSWAEISGRATGDPEVVASLRAAADHLDDQPGVDPPVGVVHGDLHGGNVFVAGSRERPTVSFIDLDGAGVGDPARDVANLACHLVLDALVVGDPDLGWEQCRTLLDAYRGAGGAVDGGDLARHQAITFHRLACVHVHRRATRHLWRSLLALARTPSTPAGRRWQPMPRGRGSGVRVP